MQETILMSIGNKVNVKTVNLFLTVLFSIMPGNNILFEKYFYKCPICYQSRIFFVTFRIK